LDSLAEFDHFGVERLDLALVVVELALLTGHAGAEALLFSSALFGVLLGAILRALQGANPRLKRFDLAPLALEIAQQRGPSGSPPPKELKEIDRLDEQMIARYGIRVRTTGSAGVPSSAQFVKKNGGLTMG
jgi:hypothetical protein